MPAEGLKLHGFYRVQLEQDGAIVGDSGLLHNQVTNEGTRDYLCRLLGGLANSKQVSHAALGTGGAPNATATTLPGEIDHSSTSRAAVTAATSGSSAVQFTATFASSQSFMSATANISNIGLFQQSNTTTATLFAGKTFASSSCATNQNVNVTYTISFS